MAPDSNGAGALPVPRFVREVDVRFHDLDAMGHAHHTLPLIYLEEARAAYWREVGGRESLDGIDYVMAEVAVRFHGRIEYPSRLSVGLRVSRIGTKSFEMEFEIRSVDGERKASGRTVQVMYDYENSRAKEMPAELRARIQAFEGDSLRA
jgi:acyl-CoA thioester hydrolase